MGWEDVEDEAYIYGNYTLGAWLVEHWEIKARVIAQYLIHGMREEYAAEMMEKARPGAPAATGGVVPGWASDGFQNFSQRAKG